MFKAGDKVKRKKEYITASVNFPVRTGEVVTVHEIGSEYFTVKEYSGNYAVDYFELVEPAQETVGFETKVLQAIAKGVLSNDQQMLAELVIKRDILQKEIERLNQQIYAKQADVNRLTNFVA